MKDKKSSLSFDCRSAVSVKEDLLVHTDLLNTTRVLSGGRTESTDILDYLAMSI